MYYCPICKTEYGKEESVAKCLLRCWKKQNPNHKSNEAPHSEDLETRTCSSDIENFFLAFEEKFNGS